MFINTLYQPTIYDIKQAAFMGNILNYLYNFLMKWMSIGILLTGRFCKSCRFQVLIEHLFPLVYIFFKITVHQTFFILQIESVKKVFFIFSIHKTKDLVGIYFCCRQCSFFRKRKDFRITVNIITNNIIIVLRLIMKTFKICRCIITARVFTYIIIESLY